MTIENIYKGKRGSRSDVRERKSFGGKILPVVVQIERIIFFVNSCLLVGLLGQPHGGGRPFRQDGVGIAYSRSGSSLPLSCLTARGELGQFWRCIG